MKPWIHGVQTLPGGSQNETWLSPEREMCGMRYADGSAYFDELKAGVRCHYFSEPGDTKDYTLYRVPLPPSIAASGKQFASLFRGIMRGDTSLDFSLPGSQTVSRERRTVIEGRHTWVDFEFVFQHASRDETVQVVFRVDPKTNLPVSMSFVDTPGQTPLAETVFDFPEEDAGPSDIYDLGVPRTAKLIDRMASSKLSEIIAAVRDAQRKFGPYFAVVAHTHGPHSKPWQAVSFHLVWRKGAKFRIETAQLWSEKGPEEPRAGTDMLGWWKEKLKNASFLPQRVCDGKTVWVRDSAKWKRFTGVNDGDEFYSYVGCVGIGTMPDAVAYGNPPEGSEACDVVLVEDPAEGPAGCLLAEMRFRERADCNAYHLSRYWYDPRHAYVMRRMEFSDLRPKKGDADGYDAYDVEAVAQSPSGVWYPTRVRRSYGPMPDDGECYWYFVDFQASLPDSLFEPGARTEALE